MYKVLHETDLSMQFYFSSLVIVNNIGNEKYTCIKVDVMTLCCKIALGCMSLLVIFIK